MTVKELRYLLADLPDDERVVFKPENSSYVEDFDDYCAPQKRNVIAFWGADFEAIVLTSDGQAGNLS